VVPMSSNSAILQSIGFWDYTCPGHGSVEQYTCDDWSQLLDEMSAAGMNSLVLGVKWLSTGYRSQLNWLDQRSEDSLAVRDDNRVIHHVLAEARKRRIQTWLLVVATQYHIPSFGMEPLSQMRWGDVGLYDLDQPAVEGRIVDLFDEVIQLFGSEADGLVVELEFCDRAAPHRIEPYNQWADTNNRPNYKEISHIPPDPRCSPFEDWRDYTTDRRVDVCRKVEHAVRAGGFHGELAVISEMRSAPYLVMGACNLERLRDGLPGWSLVTYDDLYDRTVNRLASMDICIEQPREVGFDVHWVTRGVMTFSAGFAQGTGDLERQWQLSIEDALNHRPDSLWLMGADARHAGMVCNAELLPQWGFDDGRAARRRLFDMLRPLTSNADI